MNSPSIKEREFVSTDFLNSHGNPCKLNTLSIMHKLKLFIQYSSKNMLNKPENEGTQALHTLLTYKY